MPKRRAPKSILALLTDALDRVERGPDRCSLDCLGEGEDFKRGADAEASANDGWRDTWIAPQLRQVLSYLNGTHTEIEIRVYSYGYERKHEAPRARVAAQAEPDCECEDEDGEEHETWCPRSRKYQENSHGL